MRVGDANWCDRLGPATAMAGGQAGTVATSHAALQLHLSVAAALPAGSWSSITSLSIDSRQIKELRGQVDHFREAHATVSREMEARLAEAQGASAKLAKVRCGAALRYAGWTSVPAALCRPALADAVGACL